MGYADKMFEEALDSLREDNKKLRDDLDKHVQFGIASANVINEFLLYVSKKDKADYDYFVKLVEDALKKRPKSAIGRFC